jgi:hypothetical protein
MESQSDKVESQFGEIDCKIKFISINFFRAEQKNG